MIKLIFTSASPKEIPTSWIKGLGYPIITLKALEKGYIPKNSSILFLITGYGKLKSIEAAIAISKKLSPIGVINLGTCGINSKEKNYKIGDIFYIKKTKTNKKDSESITFDYLPFPIEEEINFKFDKLESVERPLLKNNPSYYPLIDMEAGFQHKIFRQNNIPFYSIKIATDYCNLDTPSYYDNLLPKVKEKYKTLLSFLDISRFSPKISVIIPVRNRSAFIKRALQSVLNQSYAPFEILVIDDASTTPLSVSLPQHIKSKIQLYTLKKNKGVSFCRNLGIKKAKGDWIALLDSDDLWQKDKLQNQVNYLKKNPFLEILQCEEIWIRNGKRVNKCKHHEKKEGFIFEKSMELCSISPSAVLLRKELFKEFGEFDVNFPACEDYELWLRISRHKPVGLNREADLIKYGGHSDQLSMAYPAMDRFRAVALLKILEKEKSEDLKTIILENLRKRLNILYNGAIKREKNEFAHLYKELLQYIEHNNLTKLKWQNYQILLKKYI